LKKSIIVLSTAFILSTGAFDSSVVHAESSSSIINLNAKSIENKLMDVNNQLKKLNQAILDNETILKKTEIELEETKKELPFIEKEISEIEYKVEYREHILKERVKALQMNDNQLTYLDAIFGASDLGEMFSRVYAVKTILDSDEALLREQNKDLEIVTEKQSIIEEKIHSLTDKKTEIQGMMSQIEEQKEESDRLKNELQEKQKEESDRLKRELQEKQKNETVQHVTRTNTLVASTTPISNFSNKVSTPRYVAVAAKGSAQTVVSAGNQYIGNSVYVFGGGRSQHDIEHGRFDCSGFVIWAFKQAGISLSGGTDSLKRSGNQVSTNEMQPGDIVFFDTYKKDGHVGIYIGNGQFIGSQSSTGVGISSLTSGYWESVFNGRVVRVL